MWMDNIRTKHAEIHLYGLLPVVDASTKSGSMEFSAPSSTPADFFPLLISFSSKTSYVNIKVTDVILVDDESPVKYSVETVFFTDNYEVV